MSDNVADLGFSIDSGPIDKGADSLDKLTASAQKTEDQANKTSDALNKMGAGSAASGLSKTAQSVEQLAASMVKATDASGKYVSVSDRLDQIVAKTGASYTQASAALKAAIDAHKNASDAASSHGAALGGLGRDASSAAPAIDAVAKSVSNTSNALSGVGQFIKSSSVELTGFVSAAVAASTAITKAGDEVLRAKNNFNALTGSAVEGEKAYSAVKSAADATGVEFSALSSAIEKATQGQDKLSAKNVIWVDIALSVSSLAKQLADTFGTIGKAMQNAGATADEEKAVFNALGTSIGKTGGLTADAFAKIRDASLPTARALATAFGASDLNKFQAQLEQTPKTFAELVGAINRVKPEIDAAFDPTKPQTFEQAARGVAAAWNDLLETLAQTGAFDGVKTALTAIGQILRQDAQDAAALASAIKAAANAASSVGSNIGQVASGNGQGASSNQQYDQFGNPTGFNDYTANPYSYDNSGYINDNVAAGFDGTGTSTAGDGFTFSDMSDVTDGGSFASGGSFVVGGSGGTDSQTVTFKATPGEVVTVATPDQAASATGSLIPISSSDDTDIAKLLEKQTQSIVDAINSLKNSVTNETSGPSTGKNSTTSSSANSLQPTSLDDYIKFKSGPLGGGLTGGGSGGSKGSSQSKDQSQQQANSLPQLSQPASRDLGLGSSYATGSSVKGAFGSGGGGSASRPGDWLHFSDGTEVRRDSPEGRAALAKLQAAGYVRGSDGEWYKPGGGSSRMIDNPYPGLKDLQDGTDKTNKGLDDANQKLSDLSGTGERTVSAIDNAAGSITGAVSANQEAFQTGLASLGSEIAQALASIGGTKGGGGVKGSGSGASSSSGVGAGSSYGGGSSGGYYGGGGYGGGSGYDSGDAGYDGYDTGFATVGANTYGDDGGGSVFNTGTEPFNDYGLGYDTGGDFGQGGSTVGDVASDYMSSGGADYTSSAGFGDYFSGGSSSYGGGGNDTSAVDYGGGSYDAGYFAKGGQFVVPGSGDGDHSLVKIHATPGEVVTVTPKGLTTPASIPVSPLMLNPSSANDNGSAQQQQQAAPAPVETKIVNMYLHPGVQAEQFLRSRAQIARGM